MYTYPRTLLTCHFRCVVAFPSSVCELYDAALLAVLIFVSVPMLVLDCECDPSLLEASCDPVGKTPELRMNIKWRQRRKTTCWCHIVDRRQLKPPLNNMWFPPEYHAHLMHFPAMYSRKIKVCACLSWYLGVKAVCGGTRSMLCSASLILEIYYTPHICIPLKSTNIDRPVLFWLDMGV